MPECRWAVRAVAPDDGPALGLMYRRCSATTRYQRFQVSGPELPAEYLGTVLHPASGVTSIVATAGPEGDRRPVALASTCPVSPGVAELGMLVEDGWQRQGIGRLLVRRLVALGRDSSLHALTAQALTTRRWVLRLLREEAGGEVSYGPMSDTVRITATLGPLDTRSG